MQNCHSYVKVNWRLWLPLGTLCAVVGVAWAGWNATGIPGAAAKLEEDLIAVEKMGLPVNADEIRAVASQTPGPNAGPIYQSLSKRLVHNPRAARVSELYSLSRYGLTPAEHKQAAKAVADFTSELELARRASLMPALNFDRPWEEGAWVLLPEYAQMRILSFGFLLRSVERSRAGDIDGALADVNAILRMGSQCQQEPTVISTLVGSYIQATGLNALEQICQEHPVNRKLLNEALSLARSLEAIDARRAMSSEMWFGMTFYKQMASHPDEFARDFGMRSSDMDQSMKLVRFASIRRAYEGRFAHYHRKLFEAIPRDPNKFEESAFAFDRMSSDIQHDGSAITQGAFGFMKIGFPFWDFADAIRGQIARRRVAEAGIKILLDGAPYPKLPELPEDPFTHKSLAYRTDGKSFVVWSVGENKEDDGGVHTAIFNQGDITFGYPAVLVKGPRPTPPKSFRASAGAPLPANP
jgi:hypothetical protein